MSVPFRGSEIKLAFSLFAIERERGENEMNVFMC